MSGAAFYDADAGDRIVAMLVQARAVGQKRLIPSARLAGQQLEWLMPAVLAHGINGRLIAGKFTTVVPDTLLFVFADEERVATVRVLNQPNLVEQFVEIAQQLRRYIATNSGNMSGAGVSLISLFLNEHGGAPGAVTPPAPTLSAQNTIGTLFAALTDEEVRRTLGNAREIRSMRVSARLSSR